MTTPGTAAKRKVDEPNGLVDPNAPAPPVKRGRGRPRKHPIPETPPVKRPRGRPRKDTVNPADLSTQKRPRGRPPKNAADGDAATASASTSATPKPKAAAKKTTTTPKKPAAPKTPKAPVDPNAPKRPRGRPPKNPQAAAAPTAPAPASAQAQAPPPMPAPMPAQPTPGPSHAGPSVAGPSGTQAMASPVGAQAPPSRSVASEATAAEATPTKAEPSKAQTATSSRPTRATRKVTSRTTSKDTSKATLPRDTLTQGTPNPTLTPTLTLTPTPTRKATLTRGSASTSRARPAAPLPRGRLAESLAAASTAKPRGSPTAALPLPSFDDDVFGDSPSVSISSEAFRSNEALRRAREARNFTFEGDAHAPRTTRSGRIVAPVDEYGGEVGEETEDTEEEAVEDEYGEEGTEAEPEVEVEPEVEEDVEVVEGPSLGVSAPPLPVKATARLVRILETLTGREPEPAPLVDEEGNEALQGVLSLLRGTVERGEGNSALVTGPRGVGKTRTVERALSLLPPSAIVVRLSGHAQTDDRRAIREMGRQIALAEGKSVDEEDDDDVPGDTDFAPTTLPSHLLALLTAPSPRAIIVVIDEFDLFTEHARQALLYCLLDVVQSVQTGAVERTGRGMAVIGITSRVDTLLLLEKRVKSRFSHRVWRVSSPLAPGGPGWRAVVRGALVPWDEDDIAREKDRETRTWMGDWAFAIDMLLNHKKVSTAFERLAGLTTDVRLLFRPLIPSLAAVITRKQEFLSVAAVLATMSSQLELSGWGTGVSGVSKLRGLSQPALGVLIVAKHLAYAGRTDFTLAQVEDEYLRFARTRLVGSGRARWPLELLRAGFDHCRALGLLAAAGPGSAGRRFSKFRATLSPHEVVAFFRGEGATILGPELVGWGKLSGGHV